MLNNTSSTNTHTAPIVDVNSDALNKFDRFRKDLPAYKMGLIIGRNKNEPLPTEGKWKWISIDSADIIENKLDASRIHLKANINDSDEMEPILQRIGSQFDKVFVDFSVWKSIAGTRNSYHNKVLGKNIIETLTKFLKINPQSELIFDVNDPTINLAMGDNDEKAISLLTVRMGKNKIRSYTDNKVIADGVPPYASSFMLASIPGLKDRAREVLFDAIKNILNPLFTSVEIKRNQSCLYEPGTEGSKQLIQEHKVRLNYFIARGRKQ